MIPSAVVVPCYNEAARIELARFEELLAKGQRLWFVDDGSTDQTRALLEAFAARHPTTVRVLPLERNSGKAEAVRRGLLAALEGGLEQVAYLDADLATPPSEMMRVLAGLATHDVSMGSRVALLGRNIERSPSRHILGRVFATAASLSLQLPVYDTQCGAKAFRDTPALRTALLEPFTSRWAFDVELLGRLLAPADGVEALVPSRFIEVPLHQWKDVRGSKLSAAPMVKAGLDVLRFTVRRFSRRR
jgi:dolichyl-phosphate beta-glucosyltransferase